MQLSVLLVPPLMSVFRVCAMSVTEWVAVLLLAVTPLVVCEIEKALRRVFRR
jgi:Ca2+-transporting ATPase